MMKRTSLRISMFIVAVCVLASSASADLIGTISIQGGFHSAESNILTVAIRDNYPLQYEMYVENTLADVGIERSILYSHSSASTNYFTSTLTNGIDNLMYIFEQAGAHDAGGSGGGLVASESHFIDNIVNPSGPDFYGYTITDVTFEMHNLAFNAPLPINGWTGILWEGTYRFYGVVPEPTTIMLLGLGGLVLRRRYRR